MTAELERSRPGGRSLVFIAVALALAVAVVPYPLAGVVTGPGRQGISAFAAGLGSGLQSFWASDSATLPPALAHGAALWAVFHLAKAALSAALLVALLLIVRRLWRTLAGRSTLARLPHTLLISTVAAIALLAFVVVVANLQGALVPLSSALGLIPFGAHDPALGETTSQIRDTIQAGESTPALSLLLADFARYHLVMVALGLLSTAALGSLGAYLWRMGRALPRQRRADRWTLGAAVAALTCTTAFFALVTAANLSTARHPAPAFLGFLAGGG